MAVEAIELSAQSFEPRFGAGEHSPLRATCLLVPVNALAEVVCDGHLLTTRVEAGGRYREASERSDRPQSTAPRGGA